MYQALDATFLIVDGLPPATLGGRGRSGPAVHPAPKPGQPRPSTVTHQRVRVWICTGSDRVSAASTRSVSARG